MEDLRGKRLKYDYIPRSKRINIIAHNGLNPRSWSEAIIMLILDSLKISYEYEKKLECSLLPDFSLNEEIVIEHLGMLDDDNYKEHWEKKKKLYKSLDYTIKPIRSIKTFPMSKTCIITTEEDLYDLNTLINNFSTFANPTRI